MASQSNETFKNGRIDVDGEQFNACKFISCVVVYRGGQLPSFDHCTFEDSKIEFANAADRTLMLIKAMAQRGSGVESLISATLKSLSAN